MKRTVSRGRILFLLISMASAAAIADGVNFDNNLVGRSPDGWAATITGQGESKWTVEAEGSAPSQPNVLKQSAKAPRSSFPLCIKDGTSIQNGFVEVKFKALAGEIDQSGGVIWRCQSATNYYVCRANALEDNVVLYKVENGRRTVLPIVGRQDGYGVNEKVSPAQWHTLRVEFAGARFKVSFNGKPLFEVEDKTFTQAGRVGLWTKADSVTLFDDFSFGGE